MNKLVRRYEVDNIEARLVKLEKKLVKNRHDSDDLGRYLKSLRISKGISTREVSRRSGVSHPYLSQLENGHCYNPTPDVLRKLSKCLNVSYMKMMIKAGYVTNDDLKEYLQE